MGLKTRKKTSKKKGICSIPELRRSFEYIEQYVDNKIDANETKEHIVSSLKKEWEKVFFKNLDKKSADAFVKDRLNVKHKAPRTLRRKGKKEQKGGGPIAGAPLDYVTRPGIYLEQGQIPSSQSFGSYIPYVDKGFWNPMPGRSFDPLIGQQRFPTTTPVGMGSNVFKGGKRRVRRGGAIPAQVSSVGSFLSEAYNHPISASSPPTPLQDMQDMWYGKQMSENPDQVQRSPSYRSM